MSWFSTQLPLSTLHSQTIRCRPYGGYPFGSQPSFLAVIEHDWKSRNYGLLGRIGGGA
jgi:hypothetical protein